MFFLSCSRTSQLMHMHEGARTILHCILNPDCSKWNCKNTQHTLDPSTFLNVFYLMRGCKCFPKARKTLEGWQSLDWNHCTRKKPNKLSLGISEFAMIRAPLHATHWCHQNGKTVNEIEVTHMRKWSPKLNPSNKSAFKTDLRMLTAVVVSSPDD